MDRRALHLTSGKILRCKRMPNIPLAIGAALRIAVWERSRVWVTDLTLIGNSIQSFRYKDLLRESMDFET
jgi:hypothetical protein